MREILSIVNTKIEGQGYAIHSSPLPEAIKKAVRGAFSDDGLRIRAWAFMVKKRMEKWKVVLEETVLNVTTYLLI